MVKVGAVVVLYNPNFDVTKKTLSSLASQVDQICVVDNSPSDHSEVLSGYESVEYKPLLKNIGIASDHRNQPQQPHNSVIVLFVGVDKSQQR